VCVCVARSNIQLVKSDLSISMTVQILSLEILSCFRNVNCTCISNVSLEILSLRKLLLFYLYQDVLSFWQWVDNIVM